jgi:hypothetical protein
MENKQTLHSNIQRNALMGNYMARIRRKYTHGNEDVEARSKMEEIFIQWYVHTVG